MEYYSSRENGSIVIRSHIPGRPFVLPPRAERHRPSALGEEALTHEIETNVYQDNFDRMQSNEHGLMETYVLSFL